jgi:hypothetical protein
MKVNMILGATINKGWNIARVKTPCMEELFISLESY